MKFSINNTFFLFVFFLLFFSVNLFSQKDKKSTEEGMEGYKFSIGLRGGFESGLTLKYFLQENKALEGILSTHWGYSSKKITGLYEIHNAFPEVKGLDWFYGVGAHIGTYSLRIMDIMEIQEEVTMIKMEIGTHQVTKVIMPL